MAAVVGITVGLGIAIWSAIHHFKKVYKTQSPVVKKEEEEKEKESGPPVK
jgi:hypothetical protein